MKMLYAVVLSLAALTAAPIAARPTVAEAAAVIGATNDAVAAMKQEKPYDEVFAPAFVQAVPEEQFRALVRQLEAQYGALQGPGETLAGGNGGTFEVTLKFEKAVGHALIHLEAAEPHRIDGFRITNFDLIGDTPEKIATDFAALPGLKSALVTELGGKPILAIDPAREMAVGSTFKLYVLSALSREVTAGKRQWSDVVTLGPRSLPSGQMQDWPGNAPVTLQTLATMMISISDNTATDTLVRLVGQEALAKELAASGHTQPSLDAPFLTTRQMFQLKGGEDAAIADYLATGAGARGEILRKLDAQPIDRAQIASKLFGAPRALEIEWFASANDLAGILERLRDGNDPVALGILAINPSMAANARGDWQYVGYKGGSEPGVLNFSWLLRDKSGRWFAVVTSWNDPKAPVEESRLGLLAQRLITLVAKD